MMTQADFNDCFSIGPAAHQALEPGRTLSCPVPAGRHALITDIYVDNAGEGDALLEIAEKPPIGGALQRYSYRTRPGQVLVLSLSTGLRLPQEGAALAEIVVGNSRSSTAAVFVRVNGRFV